MDVRGSHDTCITSSDNVFQTMDPSSLVSRPPTPGKRI